MPNIFFTKYIWNGICKFRSANVTVPVSREVYTATAGPWRIKSSLLLVKARISKRDE